MAPSFNGKTQITYRRRKWHFAVLFQFEPRTWRFVRADRETTWHKQSQPPLKQGEMILYTWSQRRGQDSSDIFWRIDKHMIAPFQRLVVLLQTAVDLWPESWEVMLASQSSGASVCKTSNKLLSTMLNIIAGGDICNKQTNKRGLKLERKSTGRFVSQNVNEWSEKLMFLSFSNQKIHLLQMSLLPSYDLFVHVPECVKAKNQSNVQRLSAER